MKSLVEAGGYALEMDVTREEQIVAGVKKIMEEQGRIDVLVNNAGYAVYGAVEDISMEDARRQFDVNIFGPLGWLRKCSLTWENKNRQDHQYFLYGR